MYECDNNIFTTAPERALLSSLDPNEKSKAEEDSCDGEFIRLYEFVDFFFLAFGGELSCRETMVLG